MGAPLSLSIFVRHDICQPLRRAYEVITTLSPWFTGTRRLFQFVGSGPRLYFLGDPFLGESYTCSCIIIRIHSRLADSLHTSALFIGPLGVLSVQLFFRCSTQAGNNDAPCSQQKGSGCRIIGSVSVPTPSLDSPTRSWCIGCKNASQNSCYSNNRHLLIRRVVPTGSWRKIKVVLAFVVKLEP